MSDHEDSSPKGKTDIEKVPKKTDVDQDSGDDEDMPNLPNDNEEDEIVIPKNSNIDDECQLPTKGNVEHINEEDIIRKAAGEDVDSGIQITVKDPTTKKTGMGSHTEYSVEGNDQNGEFSVKRRFNEFSELRTKLLQNWPGIYVPSLPEKKAIGNKGAEFIKDRTEWLDHFVKNLSRLPHLFYSEECQIFVGSDDVSKKIIAVPVDSPIKLYAKYKEHFPKMAEKECDEETIERVEKYFKNLDGTLKYFRSFRVISKEMQSLRKKQANAFSMYMKYTISDYKRKMTTEEKEAINERFKDFAEKNSEQELVEFNQILKSLILDLESFQNIKETIKNITLRVESHRKKETT